MDDNTKSARRDAHESVKPKKNKRAALILATLGVRKMTASEITEELVKAGALPYFNRNFVAPRLSELKDAGLVETVGRRKATRSNIQESVWARVAEKAKEAAKEAAQEAAPPAAAETTNTEAPAAAAGEQLTLFLCG